ncbi:LysR family transcriptional regulator [Variovorax sp. Sphag1AA]|uniref:LysR family transcriptional regulator n=1 Tax=Variovorax sp. Sphag1AA TaxID=2587027 RepID=UPI001616DE92|nr:LysR family transcriptional regulator [Variovorax sp. Sphag1AA]MBB3178589.1 LysR family transcriptional regulator of gallate degradation [Variovorax sp. Sphag1AA]
MLAINPRHLKVFLAVAHAGSVVRAADVVPRVQSAITRSVQELEADLGVPLFERHPHGMLLTEFGSVLQARAEAAFAELDAGREAIDALLAESRWNTNAPILALGIGKQRLLVFIELMKQRHMGAVAEQFGISQPAVSLALREVEQGMGLALVTRTAAGIVPNAVGEQLAFHLRRALAELAKAEEEIVSIQQGITGRVTVGTLSLGRGWLLPQAIIRITEAHPKIRVSTVEGSFEHLASLLHAGELDFILGGLRPEEEMAGFRRQPIFGSGIVLLARKDHPLCESLQTEGWRGLEGARWVLPHRGTWTRSSLEATLADSQLPPAEVVVETADNTITRALVMTGDLITAAAPHLFQEEIASGRLVVLPLAPTASPRDIGIVVRANGTLTVAGRLLIESVMGAMTDAPAAEAVQ